MRAAVLDSYAVISFLEREKGFEAVAQLFEECIQQDKRVFLCVVNWGEVIYHALREGGEETAHLAEQAMRALPIQLVDAGEELTRQAARLKASHRMSYADCFAAASAISKKCELLTGDPEFKQVEKQVRIRWI